MEVPPPSCPDTLRTPGAEGLSWEGGRGVASSVSSGEAAGGPVEQQAQAGGQAGSRGPPPSCAVRML